jgi:hypothetical protein
MHWLEFVVSEERVKNEKFQMAPLAKLVGNLSN